MLELYQAGSEGPQWWLPQADTVRGGSVAGILDRCSASRTCPKIIEHFGSAEVWALKLTPEWVGTDGKTDLPLPDNLRRYCIASSSHGGGVGGFDTSLPGVGLHKTGSACPGNNFGSGTLPANMVPHSETVNPRLSLEERYRDHDGYVAAVRRAADKAMKQGFLLAPDAAALVRAAQDSAVLH